jgi:hypothetical protein
MDLIHYVVKDGVLDSAAQLGDAISPMDQHGASEVELPSVCLSYLTTYLPLTTVHLTRLTFFFFFFRPNLFASCNNTFSKWWEVLRLSCRRVLSSTPM